MAFKPAICRRRLGSQDWHGGASRSTLYPHDLYAGRPVSGVLNTWADLTPCHGHLPALVEKGTAGDQEAGHSCQAAGVPKALSAATVGNKDARRWTLVRNGIWQKGDFDRRHEDPQAWDITLKAGAKELGSATGGAPLHVNNKQQDLQRSGENAGLYARFTDLSAVEQSDMDLRPLHRMADAFMIDRGTAAVAAFYD